MCTRIYAFEILYNPFGDVLRNGTTGSCGHSVCNILRKLHPVLHSSFTMFHYHQYCTKIPIYPHSWQCLFCSVSCLFIRFINFYICVDSSTWFVVGGTSWELLKRISLAKIWTIWNSLLLFTFSIKGLYGCPNGNWGFLFTEFDWMRR